MPRKGVASITSKERQALKQAAKEMGLSEDDVVCLAIRRFLESRS
jgi:hypothetical protein